MRITKQRAARIIGGCIPYRNRKHAIDAEMRARGCNGDAS